jgi:hypothetical protein
MTIGGMRVLVRPYLWHDLLVSAQGKHEVIAALQRLLSEWAAGPPGHWENLTVPAYLEAMAAWLEVYEQVFINTGRPVPEDGWTVFANAVRAAAIYE